MPFITDPAMLILQEIRHHGSSRNDVAMTYRLCLKSVDASDPIWRKINRAIARRWARNGLEYVKRRAGEIEQQYR